MLVGVNNYMAIKKIQLTMAPTLVISIKTRMLRLATET